MRKHPPIFTEGNDYKVQREYYVTIYRVPAIVGTKPSRVRGLFYSRLSREKHERKPGAKPAYRINIRLKPGAYLSLAVRDQHAGTS